MNFSDKEEKVQRIFSISSLGDSRPSCMSANELLRWGEWCLIKWISTKQANIAEIQVSELETWIFPKYKNLGFPSERAQWILNKNFKETHTYTWSVVFTFLNLKKGRKNPANVEIKKITLPTKRNLLLAFPKILNTRRLRKVAVAAGWGAAGAGWTQE